MSEHTQIMEDDILLCKAYLITSGRIREDPARNGLRSKRAEIWPQSRVGNDCEVCSSIGEQLRSSSRALCTKSRES